MVDLALAMPDRVRGLVVVNANGGLATNQLRALPDTAVLAIAGHAPRPQRSIGLLRTYARLAGKAVEFQTGPKRPWCLALPLAAAEIEAFARRVTK